MSYHDIKPRKTDTLFSTYIRTKRGWRCERCGRLGKYEGQTLYKMEASHYFSRRFENTRFDEDNVRCLCFTCHQRMGGHTREEKSEYDLWMQELLGPTGYKQLKLRANLYKKRDDKQDLMYIKLLCSKTSLNKSGKKSGPNGAGKNLKPSPQPALNKSTGSLTATT